MTRAEVSGREADESEEESFSWMKSIAIVQKCVYHVFQPPLCLYLCLCLSQIYPPPPSPPPMPRTAMHALLNLNILAHHGNHEVEQANGLDEGESQNGVREQLTPQAGIARHGHQQGGEDESDTDAGAAEADGRGTHAQVLGDLDHGVGDLGAVGAGGGLLADQVAGGGVEDRGRLLALQGVEGGGGGGAEAVGGTFCGLVGKWSIGW